MTLLLALIANAIHANLLGEPFASNVTIVAVWVCHLLFHWVEK